jgi:site-specific DNA-methyltransferase (adenine-specific)
MSNARVMYEDDRFALIHGEALTFVKSLPDKSVDIILTDPPYSKHVHENLGKERRNDGAGPRIALNFAAITDDYIKRLTAEYVRVCKGWILSFSDFYSTHMWGTGVRDAGGAWVRTGQWVKTSPMPQMTGDRPACGAEDILVAHAEKSGFEWNGGGHAAIWRGKRDQNKMHPNQKPVWLLQSLLGMFAPKGALVLDPFLGSGSTAVAAFAAGREIGEADPETLCDRCARKKVSEYAPPLPEGLRVIGVELDVVTATKALERVTGKCFSQ